MLATKELREEHSAVKLMLKVLGRICEKISAGEEVDAVHLVKIVEFLRVFVDRCHHAKEEEFLFPELEKLGIPNEGGPVGVMLTEHEKGRNYIKGLSEAIEKYQGKDYSSTADLVSNAKGYIELLTQHIEKEDGVLFAMADQLIDSEGQEKLVEKFEEIEEERIGVGKHEEFHEFLHELRDIYLSK